MTQYGGALHRSFMTPCNLLDIRMIPFAMRKVAFQLPICRLSGRKRRSFAMRKVTSCKTRA